MPLLSELLNTIDPEREAYAEPEAEGEHFRETLNVDDETGRRTIQKIQPELEHQGVAGKLGYIPDFLQNLTDNVGEFATGMFTAATYPFREPTKTGKALLSPIETAKFLGTAVVEGYKQAYTPKEGESVPGMILRRFYEKPLDSLMDASMLAQIASGGAGLAVRAATAGTRATAEGLLAADLVAAGLGAKIAPLGKQVKTSTGLTTILGPEELAIQDVARQAASANRAIDFFDALTERARKIDPITIAQATGTKALETFAPDVLAAIRSTSRITDFIAERSSTLKAGEHAAEQQIQAALGDLNAAERQVFHPYVSGRLNLGRPTGEQLMSHTGEWVPVKGDMIRPEALEAARQKYIPIQQQLEQLRGMTDEQVAQTMGAKSMHDARKFLGDQFDPLAPQVQEFVTNNVRQALLENNEVRKWRATGEMRTALDIAKERQWRTRLEDAVRANEYENIKAAERGLPRPTQTTPEEAIAAMGPQGGIYFPHSSEAFTSHQSTIGNILTKMGEASTYKENQYALFRNGFLEHNDPVKALLRAYSTFNKGRTWVQMATDAAEQGVKEGSAFRMARDWNPHTDPDVIKGTHQPFEPGRMMTDQLVEEEGQHMLIRLMEVMDDLPKTAASDMTIDAVTTRLGKTDVGAMPGLPGATPIGDLNFHDIMKGLADQAEKGPMYRYKTMIPKYKVPTSMGHAFKELRDSMQPPTSPLLRTIDNATQWWNWTNLNVKVTRLVNNIVGNTTFAAMQGVHPFTPRGLQSLIATGKAIGAKSGVLKSAEAQNLAKIFDLPGIRSGGLQLGLEQATGTVGDIVQRVGAERGVIGKTLTAPIRGVGHWASLMAKANANVESAYRAASLFYELSPNAIERASKMSRQMGDSLSLGDKIHAFAEAGGEVSMKMPEYREALKQVNRYFNNYDRTTPFERMVTRRVFPYYKFFKHSTDLITRFPFEHPLKAAVARQVGAVALQDVKDTLNQYGMKWNRDVPPQMRDSLPIFKTTNPDTGEPVVWMYNTKGANPFSQMNGYASEQVLQMLNPVVKVAIERATGVNLFTRERYRGAISSFTGREVDPKTGAIVDSFNHPSYGEAFLRSFWPYQTAREFAAQGRIPTDTASLIEMATNGPNAWQYDERGFELRKPTLSPLQAAGRFVGAIPAPLEKPTPEQAASRKAVINNQLNTLYQRYPERRSAILTALDQTAEDVALEYERNGE